MIHYHGGPITPETCAHRAWRGRHAFVSWWEPHQIELAAGICQSFALDNGAFAAWRKGEPIEDWRPYYEWAARWLKHPACDWAVIPDVIGGTEAENNALIDEWPHGTRGVPVWHTNEPIDRLVMLAADFPRVALGSCAEWDVKHVRRALGRITVALTAISDNGTPRVKVHGLRMLNPALTTVLPLSSADSTNVAFNIGHDVNWKGPYEPATKETKVDVLIERIESHPTPASLQAIPIQDDLWGSVTA